MACRYAAQCGRLIRRKRFVSCGHRYGRNARPALCVPDLGAGKDLAVIRMRPDRMLENILAQRVERCFPSAFHASPALEAQAAGILVLCSYRRERAREGKGRDQLFHSFVAWWPKAARLLHPVRAQLRVKPAARGQKNAPTSRSLRGGGEGEDPEAAVGAAESMLRLHRHRPVSGQTGFRYS